MMLYLIVLFLTVSWFFFASRKKIKLPLPPSPPADPFLGHLRYIPPENQEILFTEWAKTYGDVIYLRVPNRSIIVLSSAQVAIDLLDKRSANYSDRPDFPIYDLMGWGDAPTLLHYGNKFRKHRRLLQEYLNSAKVSGYADLQTTLAKQLVLSLAEGKDDREHILQKYGTAVVVRIAFGHDMYQERDPMYDEMIRVHKVSMTSCGPPGNTLIDFFPILQHFPSWFPGTFYANRAREFTASVERTQDYPMEQTQRQLVEGIAKPSFLAHHLDKLQQEGMGDRGEDFMNIRAAAGAIFGAGSETMWSTLSAFFLAMVLHPECQAKAHEELDRVLSPARLPTFADRKSLPYIDCIVQEVYRWLPVTPLGTVQKVALSACPFHANELYLGLPHRAMEDDVYEGMFIPGGTIVFANLWAISRDERIHRDGSRFNPSRYQTRIEGGNEEPLPAAVFGFGRRICPGRHLADTNFWMVVATVLAIFRIETVKDENGEDIVPEVRLQTGLTSHPKPYQCSIQVRNEAAKALLADIEAELAVMR